LLSAHQQKEPTEMLKTLSALAFTFLLTATSAYAQQLSRLDDIIKRGTLRVGMTGDYLPFTSLDKDNQKFRGFDGVAGDGERFRGRQI
jgi:cyclohexadienyl dehydratase